jgi:hypothetical protein
MDNHQQMPHRKSSTLSALSSTSSVKVYVCGHETCLDQYHTEFAEWDEVRGVINALHNCHATPRVS